MKKNPIQLDDRRKVLQFLGYSTAATASLTALNFLGLSSCSSAGGLKNAALDPFLLSSGNDELSLMKGLKYQVLIQQGQAFNLQNNKAQPKLGQSFGDGNDYLAYFALNDQEGILWVNHEYSHPLFVSGFDVTQDVSKKTRNQMLQEMDAVGGSLLHIKKNQLQNYELVKDSKLNRRLTGLTAIPFAMGVQVMGSKKARGTIANCAGGVTPWGTVLSCEENYDHFVGEVDFKDGQRKFMPSQKLLSWTHLQNTPPEHYGWVVEVNPFTGKAQKHTALGRFRHEGATCVKAKKDQRVVVYMGDDKVDEHFYKFISDSSQNLNSGVLYVADFKKGQWLEVSLNHPKLKNLFKDHLDLMIQTPYAAKIIGATPLDRPEDCKINPINNEIILALSNNKPAGRPYGSLVKIKERDGDFLSLQFTSETLVLGGKKSGLACPDNLAFDRFNQLWITTDISEKDMAKGDYEFFDKNSLFVMPTQGRLSGQLIKVATAPKDAEFTGPCFSENGESLFLSVQHPGASSKDLKNLTSNWPGQKGQIPRSSVIVISGDLFKKPIDAIV